MASTPKGNAQQNQTETPASLAQGTPDNISGETGHARTIIASVQGDISEIRLNISKITSTQHTDFRIIVSMLAAGFVVLGTMLVLGYFRLEDRISKTDDRVISQITSNTRVETKLEDLLQRIPPAQTTPPQRH